MTAAPPTTMAPTRLSETLAACKAEGRAALIGYLPACFPTPERGLAALMALVDGGVDAIEVGLPYSDPVLEGPIIARSHDIALRSGSTTAHVLRTVEAIAATGVAHGRDDLLEPGRAVRRRPVRRRPGRRRRLRPDHARPAARRGRAVGRGERRPRPRPHFRGGAEQHGARLAMTARFCRGFIYAASVMGVTGTRAQTSVHAPALVDRVRATTTLPVGVGLGVSNAEQAAEVAGYADAVIVGSAFVRRDARCPRHP